MSLLHLFNPENDLALADGSAAYCAPPAAERIAFDLASLPLWFAGKEGLVYLPGDIHREYQKEWSKIFDLPAFYNASDSIRVETLRPWGWSAQMLCRFKAMGINNDIMPTERQINAMRTLSNRRSSIAILQYLKDAGADTPALPRYICDPLKVKEYIESRERCVVKAPWSGSGKGIMWGIGRVEKPMENFYKGIIKRQGGVVCEEYLCCKVEFAMEFFASAGSVDFAGYSLFNAENGSYCGNTLLGDDDIICLLANYIPRVQLDAVRLNLCRILTYMLAGSGYEGYLGVDMMIYEDGSSFRLNPCMELNLRMNMGVVARIFYDNYVQRGKRGCYTVSFYRNSGEALEEHRKRKEMFPLEVIDARISSGYLNLSPVNEDTRYVASVLIEG